MRRVSMFGTIITFLAIFAMGCSMLAEPEWSDNFTKEAECNVPKMIDGSMYSSGETQPPIYVRGERADDSRFTDVIITFKEPKDIRRITLRRRKEDVVAIDVNVFHMVGEEWKQISDTTRGEVAENVNISVRARADKIKIRSQRATRTSKGKSGLTTGAQTGAGRRTQMEQLLRRPIKYAEVEVYGLKPKTEVAESK